MASQGCKSCCCCCKKKVTVEQEKTVMVAQPPVAMALTPQNEILGQDKNSQIGGANQPYVLTPMTPSIAPTSIIQTIIPNAPSTFVIDTSPEAMEAEGFTKEIQPLKSILKKPNINRSRSSSHSHSPSFSVNKMNSDSSSNNDEPATGKSIINIVKEGQ